MVQTPLSGQVPVAAGKVLVQLMTPTRSLPGGSVSVRMVCNDSLGPLLVTTTSQSNGSRSATVVVGAPAFFAALVTARSTRRRTVVCSDSVSLAASVSGSLADTVAWLVKLSPEVLGLSSTSKRRKRLFVWPMARSPRARPVVALPAGRSQVNVGIATPAAEVTLVTEQSDEALQVLPPKVVVSQTKRTRLPVGGVITSVTFAAVAYDGPLLVTLTR